MRLLALDTAGDGCSAGVSVGSRTLAIRFRAAGTGHAEHLMPMVQAVLEQAEIDLAGLDALAVAVGPGSFTGIRTGLAAVRGLALVTGLPVWPVSTLAALAVRALADGGAGGLPIAAVLDARRGQVFIQRFDGRAGPLDEPSVAVPEMAAARLPGPHRLVGPGASLILRHLAAGSSVASGHAPDAAAVALAVATAATNGGAPIAGFALAPLYLRDADARPSAGRPLLRA